MEDIRERLRSGGVILGDGAWGTLLMQRGLKPGEPPEALNLSRPEILEEIATLYLEAGAELITTNTFGGSPLRLRAHALEGRTEEINRRAVEAVRRAIGDRAWVSASVGPSGRLLKPYGDCTPEELYANFERQIGVLVAAGADLICVETMSDLTEAALAVRAARAIAPAIPVMATMTFEDTPRGYYTVMGVSVAKAAAGLEEAGADIVGSNCGNGIETMIGIAREFRKHARLPVAIQANAGLPVTRDGALVYPETPEFVAAKAVELLDLGVRIVGGCCGTTPDHIRALRAVVDKHRESARA
jgi:5-methyltetrahydrofolate--homocysteine methyltransferase